MYLQIIIELDFWDVIFGRIKLEQKVLLFMKYVAVTKSPSSWLIVSLVIYCSSYITKDVTLSLQRVWINKLTICENLWSKFYSIK